MQQASAPVQGRDGATPRCSLMVPSVEADSWEYGHYRDSADGVLGDMLGPQPRGTELEAAVFAATSKVRCVLPCLVNVADCAAAVRLGDQDGLRYTGCATFVPWSRPRVYCLLHEEEANNEAVGSFAGEERASNMGWAGQIRG